MINLFRRTRQKLFSENRIGKYLLYVFGEIMLVIIGILIALSINNRNELQKSEDKVKAIFEEILKELSSDIYETTELARYYAVKDSTISLVLNNQLTYDAYNKPQNNSLSTITTDRESLHLTQHAYDNLIINIQAIPSEYKSVVKELIKLYNDDKKWVENYNDRISRIVEKNNQERVEKYEWYSLQIPFYENEDMIEYMLNDYTYRNKVQEFRTIGLFNHLRFILAYRKQAIKCYKQLAELLNKPTIDDSFKMDDEMLDLIAGQYKLDENMYDLTLDEDNIFSLVKNGNRLFVSSSLDTTRVEIFQLSATQFVQEDATYWRVVRQGNDILIANNYGMIFKPIGNLKK
jgi:hypothetical protein